MPRSDNKPTSWFRRMNKKLDTVDYDMDQLYQTTYTSRSDNRRDMDDVVDSIDDTIDRIINGSNQQQNVSDLSNLYVRLQKKNGVTNTDLVNSTMELFADDSIVNTLSLSEDLNREVIAEDYEYDMICRYMPSIETALEIKRDNVLSSDNFTKDFLTVSGDSISSSNLQPFDDRVRAVMEKYKFQDFAEEMYEKASKYGEAFVYCVPYNIALDRLEKRKSQLTNTGFVRSFSENGSPIYEESKGTPKREMVVFEGANVDTEHKDFSDALTEAGEKISPEAIEGMKVNLIFNDSGILDEAVLEKKKAETVLQESTDMSLSEAFNMLQESKSVDEADGLSKEDQRDPSVKFNSVYGDHKSSHTLDGGVNDGLIINGGIRNGGDHSEKIQDINGCVLEFIDRCDIIPVYLDTLCVGYYYFQFSTIEDMNCCSHGYQNGTMAGIGTDNVHNNLNDVTTDMLMSYIAQRLSANIDNHFINANKDLKEEIYAILKYNDKFGVLNGTNNVTVTFLPCEDVFHFYLKQDRDTHRGISSIKKATVPAMLYCLLYLTNTIGQVTRAQDKRIYYVKQNVETNVARTLMNVVNQIKKGNMGMRQIQSMNSILNIVGKYNDHVIPVGQSGDSPIQFEVMQGQNIETPSELMDRFENQAVESTDVPYEFVQSVNQVDYATRFTMSNSKFLRKVYKEQRICQDAFSELFTKIFNYEYGENHNRIKVCLPAPAFLSMTNTQQLVDNTRNYVNAIAEAELSNADDEVKSEFIKLMTRNSLGSYIDYSTVDECINQAKLNVKLKSDNDDENE